MRIALDLISETGFPGGIRTYWVNLVKRLAPRHPDDRWTLVGARDLQLPGELLELPNVEHHVCGESCGGALRRRVRQQLALPAILSRGRFDIVHSINNVMPLSSTVPRVVTVLDWTIRHTPGRFTWSKRLYLATLVPASVRGADAIVTISEATRRDLLEEMPRSLRADVDERTTVIPLAVDDRFHPQRTTRDEMEIRRRHELPERFTLFVGALEPGKNIARMLEAQRLIAGRGAEVPPLVIAGGGGWGGVREELERCSHQPVLPIGRVTDEELPHLYRMAEVFLFPSVWEGFGLPVLEAFASGTPVVTSNVSALPEVAGEAALLVDPEQPWEIAEAWSRLWSDESLRREHRDAGISRAREFTWERVAQETHSIYERASISDHHTTAPMSR